MRHTFLALVGALGLCLCTMSSAAQSTGGDARESAAGTRLSGYGGFGGLDLRFGDLGDEFAAFVGVEAALLLKQRVYVGIRGTGLATDNLRVPVGNSSAAEVVGMGYGGLVVGYVVSTPLLADVSLDALVGGGGVGARELNEEDWDAVFVFEPAATLDLRLAPFARIGIGVGYRFVGDVEVPGLRDAD